MPYVLYLHLSFPKLIMNTFTVKDSFLNGIICGMKNKLTVTNIQPSISVVIECLLIERLLSNRDELGRFGRIRLQQTFFITLARNKFATNLAHL